MAVLGTAGVAALRWLLLEGVPGASGVVLDTLFAALFAYLVHRAGASRLRVVAAVSIWILFFQGAHLLKISALGSPVFFSDLSTIGVLISVLKTWQVLAAALLGALLVGLLIFGVWPQKKALLPWTLLALLLPVGLYAAAPWEANLVNTVLSSGGNDYVTHLQRRGGVQFLLDQRARVYELSLKGRGLLAGQGLDVRPQLASKRNVHLVLLETFWDPMALKAFHFSRDPFDPRFRRLLEQGNNSVVMTPHFGHLTANAEFEALCGLPATEDAVFQNRMKDVLPCLPRILRELGYDTLASHSNRRDSWGRDTAYKHMGFASFNAYSSFVRDDLDGVFLNDASFYRQNRDVLARYDRASPYFNYLVTISSHYPYQLNKERRPSLVRVEPQNQAVEDYANALAYSSAAFMDWLEQVQRDDPDALIVAFGDHAPAMPPDQKPYSLSGINTNTRPFANADTLVAMSRTPLLFIDGRKGSVDVGTMPLEFLPVAITRALGMVPARLPYLTEDMLGQRAKDSTRFLGNVITQDQGKWELCQDVPVEGSVCADAVKLYDRKRALRNALLSDSRQMFTALGAGWLNTKTTMQFGTGSCLLEVSDWGPKTVEVGEQFNRQKASGQSATWLKVERIQGSPQLRIGAVSTPIVGSGAVLAALWPAPGVIPQAGKHPVEVVCGGEVIRRLGEMQVGGGGAAPVADAADAAGANAMSAGPLRVTMVGDGMAEVVALAETGNCEDGGMRQAVVKVNWKRASGGDGVRVFVQQQGEDERKLWSVSGSVGESRTGPWANDGLTLWFEDGAGVPLGSGVLTAPACALQVH